MHLQLIDSHCHLDNEKFLDNMDALVNNSVKNGVIAMVNTGYDLPSSKNGVKLATMFKQVYCTIGVHPHDAKGVPYDYIAQLKDLSKNKKVVAIGEIGLDYYYDYSPREIQKRVFMEQIDLANQLHLPYVIHQRDAMGDMLKILKDFPKPKYGALFHCYSGSLDVAKELIKGGFMLSIGGPVTFKNARKTVEVVKDIPLDYMLVETDCPYLTPEPFRGKLNYPHYVRYVVEKIAHIKEMEVVDVALKTTENSNNFFKFGLEMK